MEDPTPISTGRRSTRPPSSPGRITLAPWRLGLMAASVVALVAAIFFYGRGFLPGGNTQPAAPKAYVGLFKDNAVAVVDTGTNRVLKTIPIPPGPHGLVATPDGRRVYASSDGASTVSVIDTATDTVAASIDVGKTPHGLAITPDGKYVLVAIFGTSEVAFIDTKNNQIVGRVPVAQPHNIAISPDGKQAYVAAQKDGATALVVLDIAKLDQVASIPVPKTPRALNFSPDGRQLLFTEAGVDAVQVLDPASNRIVAQVPVGASPHHPLFTPKGDAALIVDQGPGELGIIDPLTDTLSGTVPVGKLPHWIATTADGRWAYVTNENSNDISVVDLSKRQADTTIPVGNGPRKIVMVSTSDTAMAMPGMDTAVPAGATAAAPPAPAGAAQPSAIAGQTAISIASFAFTPGTVTIAAGQTVTWTNHDTVPHTVTSNDGKWDSGTLQPGATFSQKFDQPGTYAYQCSIHPFMQGTVIVTV
jgi:YVTN family beta-propeller protein